MVGFHGIGIGSQCYLQKRHQSAPSYCVKCGKKEVLGLRIQAIDAMESFVQPCKRKRSCSVHVQRTSLAQDQRARSPWTLHHPTAVASAQSCIMNCQLLML